MDKSLEKRSRGRPRGTTKANGYKYTTSDKVGRKKIYNTPEKIEEQINNKIFDDYSYSRTAETCPFFTRTSNNI